MKMLRLLLVAYVHLLLILSLFPYRSSSTSIVFKARRTAVVGLPYEGICTIISEEYNSTDLVFQTDFGGLNCCRKIESRFTEILNRTSVRLHYREFPSEYLDRLRWITCKTNEKKSNHTKSLEITVKLPNAKPTINRQSIAIDNWERLSFVWNRQNESEKQLKLNYSCYYKESEKTVFKKGTVTNGRQCSINNPFGIVHRNNALIVKLEGIAKEEKTEKIIETVSSDEESIILYQFVKPAQVTNIEVLQLESSVTLSFEPPKLNRNITYNVVAKCDKDSNDHTVNVTREINCPPNNETRQSSNNNNNTGTNCRVSKEFTDLPAFSNCTASVRAVPVAGGRWSDWKRHDFETPEGVPRRNPEICSNCFSIRQGISDSVSDVIVYFTPLSEDEAQGKIVLYKIRILDKSSSNECFQYLNNTENNHYSFVLRNLSHRIDYEIVIEAKTSKGYNESLNMSNSIEISLSDDGLLSNSKIFNVTLINCTSNSAAVRTSWESDDADCALEKEFFLFWCEGEEKSHACKGVLNWITVAAGSRSHVSVFSGSRFNVGLGIQCDGKSSGLLWHRCGFNTAQCPTETNIESCRSTSFKITPRPNSRRFIAGAEPEVATRPRRFSLVPAIAVSSSVLSRLQAFGEEIDLAGGNDIS